MYNLLAEFALRKQCLETEALEVWVCVDGLLKERPFIDRRTKCEYHSLVCLSCLELKILRYATQSTVLSTYRLRSSTSKKRADGARYNCSHLLAPLDLCGIAALPGASGTRLLNLDSNWLRVCFWQLDEVVDTWRRPFLDPFVSIVSMHHYSTVSARMTEIPIRPIPMNLK